MTKLLGIINVTTDSFSNDGILQEKTDTYSLGSSMREDLYKKVVARGEEIISSGGSGIDVGCESTRPGHTLISIEEEKYRAYHSVKALRDKFPESLISIDTRRGEVAGIAREAGANVLNDVSGLQFCKEMSDVAPYFDSVILMDNQVKSGMPAQDKGYLGKSYKVFEDKMEGFLSKLVKRLGNIKEFALRRGVSEDKIILDPGIGFGKSVEQNLSIVANVGLLRSILDSPILLGISRKFFLGEVLSCGVEERDLASVVSGSLASCYGDVDWLRVHDVAAHKQSLHIIEKLHGLRCDSI